MRLLENLWKKLINEDFFEEIVLPIVLYYVCKALDVFFKNIKTMYKKMKENQKIAPEVEVKKYHDDIKTKKSIKTLVKAIAFITILLVIAFGIDKKVIDLKDLGVKVERVTYQPLDSNTLFTIIGIYSFSIIYCGILLYKSMRLDQEDYW